MRHVESCESSAPRATLNRYRGGLAGGARRKPSDGFLPHGWWRALALAVAALVLLPASSYAQASPWENAVNVLMTSFTGPIARGLSLVSIVVGGVTFTTALGLIGVSHHTLRHTGATVMVAGGVSLRAVQRIGGWTSLRMVEGYAHVDDAELARAVRMTRNHTEEAMRGGTKRGTEARAAGGNSESKTEANS
jgi:type IV secretory pathway VirB2 component (pilin)